MSGDVSLQDEPIIFYSKKMTMAKMVVLKQKGITLLDEITEYGEIGKFVHILDLEGNKIELWEPPKSNIKDKK